MFRAHFTVGGSESVAPATHPRVQALSIGDLVVVDGKIVMRKPGVLAARETGTLFGYLLGAGAAVLGGLGISHAVSVRNEQPDTVAGLSLHPSLLPCLATLATSLPLLSLSLSFSFGEYPADPQSIVAKRDALTGLLIAGPAGSSGLGVQDLLDSQPLTFLAPDEMRALVLPRILGLDHMALVMQDPTMLVQFGAVTLNEARFMASYANAYSERALRFADASDALKSMIDAELRDQTHAYKARLAAAQSEYEAVECVKLLGSLKVALSERITQLRKYKADRVRVIRREAANAQADIRAQMEVQRTHILSNFEQLSAIDSPDKASPPLPSPLPSPPPPPPYNPSGPPPPYNPNAAPQPPPTYGDAAAADEQAAENAAREARHAARSATLQTELARLEQLEAESLARAEAGVVTQTRKIESYVADQISQARRDFANHASHLESCVATAASIRDASMEVERRRLEQAREEVTASHFRRLAPLENAFKEDVDKLTVSAMERAESVMDWAYAAPAYSTYHLGRELTPHELAALLSEVASIASVIGTDAANGAGTSLARL